MKVHNTRPTGIIGFLKESGCKHGKKKADPQGQREEFRGKELPCTLMVVGTRV